MKRIITTVGLALLCSAILDAQDIITNKAGEDIRAKVIEVTPNGVSYKLYDEPDGPVYVVKKADLLLIRYESGRNEVFNQNPMQDMVYAYRDPVENLAPGMKYKKLKTLYNHKDYVPGLFDRYDPVMAGVASYFIPGSGQVIDGEFGRGFAFLGGTIGCIALGTEFAIEGHYDGYGNLIEKTPGTRFGAVVCYLGAVFLQVYSIIDGVRVAKVKNMYEQDLRRAYSLNIKLTPSFDCTQFAGVYNPTAGLRLAVSF